MGPVSSGGAGWVDGGGGGCSSSASNNERLLYDGGKTAGGVEIWVVLLLAFPIRIPMWMYIDEINPRSISAFQTILDDVGAWEPHGRHKRSGAQGKGVATYEKVLLKDLF
ncbi:MAG: hypothetical protein M1823_006040, partial [Watsoniomyces obsoletus]